MIERFEIVGGADPMTAAAIVAALNRLAEEQAAAAAAPPAPLHQGPWVLSKRPRQIRPVPAVRPTPMTFGWSVGSDE
jgi:hypothetical protein